MRGWELMGKGEEVMVVGVGKWGVKEVVWRGLEGQVNVEDL